MRVLDCGNSISFWNEHWEGLDALSNTFHMLYDISLMKEAKVDQMGIWRDGEWCWNFIWRRRLFVWEENMLGNMLDILNLKRIKANVVDSWCWLGNCIQPYAVNAAYKVISALEGGSKNELFRILWEKSVPLKVGAFCRKSIQIEYLLLQTFLREEFQLVLALLCVVFA